MSGWVGSRWLFDFAYIEVHRHLRQGTSHALLSYNTSFLKHAKLSIRMNRLKVGEVRKVAVNPSGGVRKSKTKRELTSDQSSRFSPVIAKI